MASKFILAGLFLAFVSNAWAQGVTSVPLPNAANSVKKPAHDLVLDGKVLDFNQAAQLSERMDLSDLNPRESKFWQDKTFSASDADTRGYPKASIGVFSPKSESFITGRAKFTSLHLVQSKENPKAYYRMAVSFASQSMMMRAALLRKLGYYVNSPKYYKNLKVTFKNEAEKEQFIAQLADDLGGIDLTARTWIVDNDKKDHSLVLQSATLEDTSNDTSELYWGTAPDPSNPANIPAVQRFSRLRAYRAAIIPFALVDVPESVNRFSTRFAEVSTGYVNIPYYLGQSFQATTYDDLRWILKRLQKLSLKDYEEIVAESNYPEEIKPLVLAKLVNRARSAFSLFKVHSSLPEMSLNINSSSGLVQAGKVTSMKVEGYPQHFAHGDRTSPFQEGDMLRLISLQGKNTLVESAIARMTEKLQIIGVQDHLKDYQQEFYNRIVDHIKNRPNEPFHREVVSWGGPIAGMNLNASRHVTTGTFTGSTAPVQLVDNLTVGAGLGIFRALDGVDKIQPIAGVNFSIARDYTHVRPITSMKEASKVSWKSLFVPSHMNKLAKILESEGKTTEDGEILTPVESFLAEMQDGELFSISDSVARTSYLQASASIDVLLGIQPLKFINSITLGADENRVMLKQVTFHRVMNERFNGVHVYVRELKNKGKGLELNANYFINLLKIRAQSTEADISTDAFFINLKPVKVGEDDSSTEAGQKLQTRKEDLKLTMLSLFKYNSTELLHSKFPNNRIEVKHNLKAKEQKIKLLAWKQSKLKEDHLIHLTPPRSEMNPLLNPKDETEILFRSKIGELRGRDIIGLLKEVGNGVLAQKGLSDKLSLSNDLGGDNPANVAKGKAYWRLINTESQLTKNPRTAYPSVGIIQHTWGGWSMKQDEFLTTLAEIKKRYENTSIASYPLINPSEFHNMKSLDFYRITANLSILGSGLDRIRDLLLQPQMDSQNPNKSPDPLLRLVQKIKCGSNKECGDRIRVANDKELFYELMKMFGNGDAQLGHQVYVQMCKEEKYAIHKEYAANLQGGAYRGTQFKCLSNWLQRLLSLAHRYPQDKSQQTRWMTQVLSILDENIPIAQLLNYLGQENYIFLIRINGFRVGEEDGDLEYFSHTVGDPQKDFSYAGGLVGLFIKKTGLMPTELDRTLGGFQ